jgi:hypothetical protein
MRQACSFSFYENSSICIISDNLFRERGDDTEAVSLEAEYVLCSHSAEPLSPLGGTYKK